MLPLCNSFNGGEVLLCLQIDGGFPMKMKVLAAALLLGSSSLAIAADAVVYEPVAFEEIPVGFNWTGAYIGAQVGYAWGDSYYYNEDDESANYDPDGFFGGVYVGYNHQLANNVVLGVDADLNFSGIDSRVGYDYLGEQWDDHVGVSDVKYTGALRARLGYAIDRWLPYVAGGLSVAKYEFNLDHDGSGDWDFKQEDTFVGWNIGAGVEYAATDNIIVRAEYRFSDFGDYNYSDDWADDGHIDLKTHDIRLGVAYKF